MFSIGTDIVEVHRIKALIERYNTKFLNKIFSDEEIKYCAKMRYPAMHYAGRFSAKEAIIKAVSHHLEGKKLFYSDISIHNTKSGKPSIVCTQINSNEIDVSISHTKEHAIAFAVYSGNDKSS